MNKPSSSKNFKWILLIHQMRPNPTRNRVMIWRRLQNIGAIPIKNSVYILPFTKEAYEHFQWLRQEITAQKGDATIFRVDFIEGIRTQDIIKQFQRIRDKDYDGVFAETVKLKNAVEGSIDKSHISVNQKEKYESELNKLKVRFNEIITIDYFSAPNRVKAQQAIADSNKIIESLKKYSENGKLTEATVPIKIYKKDEFRNKNWVTRKGIHIDRIASAWLIKRFIDKGARFSFVTENATIKNGIGFDMYNTEFSHRKEDCTFETILKSFNLKDSTLAQIAEIVHDIDLKDHKFDRPEAEGINQIIIGLSQKLKYDKKLLKTGMEIFDALYQYYS